jgi:hypothetical protein
MNNDPEIIAQDLIKELGLEDAIIAASGGISDAHVNRDNYHLSIWRDVRRILKDQLPTG